MLTSRINVWYWNTPFNLSDQYGSTAKICDVVAALVGRCYAIKANTYEDTALILACNKHLERLVEVLMRSRNIDVDKTYTNGDTVLLCATIYENLEMMQCLLIAPDLDQQVLNDNGYTADIVKLLLQCNICCIHVSLPFWCLYQILPCSMNFTSRSIVAMHYGSFYIYFKGDPVTCNKLKSFASHHYCYLIAASGPCNVFVIKFTWIITKEQQKRWRTLCTKNLT